MLPSISWQITSSGQTKKGTAAAGGMDIFFLPPFPLFFRLPVQRTTGDKSRRTCLSKQDVTSDWKNCGLTSDLWAFYLLLPQDSCNIFFLIIWERCAKCPSRSTAENKEAAVILKQGFFNILIGFLLPLKQSQPGVCILNASGCTVLRYPCTIHLIFLNLYMMFMALWSPQLQDCRYGPRNKHQRPVQ